jgi:hypothetical protein
MCSGRQALGEIFVLKDKSSEQFRRNFTIYTGHMVYVEQ